MNWILIRGLLSAGLCAFGFSLVFRLSIRLLLPATVGGVLAYGAYLMGIHFGMDLFAANFLAAAVAAFYSEICARILKAPTSVFLIPCVIPLVPGGLLYYAMSHLISTEYGEALSYLKSTILTALGIAGGIIIVSVFGGLMQQWGRKKYRSGHDIDLQR